MVEQVKSNLERHQFILLVHEKNRGATSQCWRRRPGRCSTGSGEVVDGREVFAVHGRQCLDDRAAKLDITDVEVDGVRVKDSMAAD